MDIIKKLKISQSDKPINWGAKFIHKTFNRSDTMPGNNDKLSYANLAKTNVVSDGNGKQKHRKIFGKRQLSGNMYYLYNLETRTCKFSDEEIDVMRNLYEKTMEYQMYSNYLIKKCCKPCNCDRANCNNCNCHCRMPSPEDVGYDPADDWDLENDLDGFAFDGEPSMNHDFVYH